MTERTKEAELWFGSEPPIGELSAEEAARKLRAAGDGVSADELAASGGDVRTETFSWAEDAWTGLFGRFMKTTHVCGFLADGDSDAIVPVTESKRDPDLKGQPLKVTLDALHVARYPGFGTHRLLFDFAVQAQTAAGKSEILHYGARFEARNGETVPVRNFPLFYGLKPSSEGIALGFQTINVSSSFDEGLLDFLKSDEFKSGLDVATAFAPAIGQISRMTVSLTRWLAGQSENMKVQEFRQGLDFGSGHFGGGLAAGSYIVVQIPLDAAKDWAWSDWTVDSQAVRLVRRDDRGKTLDFNHAVLGLHRIATR